MRAVLIDTSGGMMEHMFQSAKKEVKVGDYVILFNHEVNTAGQMTSQKQIDNLPLQAYGGTIVGPAIDTAVKLGATNIVVLTDGYICDRFLCPLPIDIKVLK